MQCFTARWLHPKGSRIEQGHVMVMILECLVDSSVEKHGSRIRQLQQVLG